VLVAVAAAAFDSVAIVIAPDSLSTASVLGPPLPPPVLSSVAVPVVPDSALAVAILNGNVVVGRSGG